MGPVGPIKLTWAQLRALLKAQSRPGPGWPGSKGKTSPKGPRGPAKGKGVSPGNKPGPPKRAREKPRPSVGERDEIRALLECVGRELGKDGFVTRVRTAQNRDGTIDAELFVALKKGLAHPADTLFHIGSTFDECGPLLKKYDPETKTGWKTSVAVVAEDSARPDKYRPRSGRGPYGVQVYYGNNSAIVLTVLDDIMRNTMKPGGLKRIMGFRYLLWSRGSHPITEKKEDRAKPRKRRYGYRADD